MTLGVLIANGQVSYSQVALDNFQTEQACRYAGAQQEVALRNNFQLDTNKYYTFICVPK